MALFYIVFVALWILFLAYSYKAIASLRDLAAYADLLSYDPQSQKRAPISIVIAVKDEAANIESTLARLTALNYPQLDVIVVNDRSCDNTQAFIDKVCNAHPQVRGVQIHDLPTGWLGKVNALHQGGTAQKLPCPSP